MSLLVVIFLFIRSGKTDMMGLHRFNVSIIRSSGSNLLYLSGGQSKTIMIASYLFFIEMSR